MYFYQCKASCSSLSFCCAFQNVLLLSNLAQSGVSKSKNRRVIYATGIVIYQLARLIMNNIHWNIIEESHIVNAS